MSQSRFEQAFRTTLAQLNAGTLDAAAASCAGLVRLRPDDPAVLQLQATIALRSGDPVLALRTMLRGLAFRPGHVPSLILAAQAALGAGLPGQAVPLLHEAIARAPDLPEPAFLLCHALLDLNRTADDDAALDAALRQTAARHADRAADWQHLGLALQRKHQPKAALAAFTRAVAADPTLAAAYFGRGLLLRDAGRMDEAGAALRQAVATDPSASGAWFALGLTCQDLGNEAEAAAAFQAALRERPAFAEAAVNLGIARQRLGDMPGAMQAYRTAMHIRPDTFGRIAQAVTAAGTGMLWLDTAAFRRALGA